MTPGFDEGAGVPYPSGEEGRPEYQHRLFTEQIALTYRQVPAALVGGVVNGLVLIYVLWDVSPRPYLLAWAGVGLAFAIARSLITRRFRHTPPEKRDPRKWFRVVVGMTLASGLHMGIGAAAVFPSQSVVHQVFIAFITGGLVAGSVTTYCAFPWLAPAYFVPSVLPVTARFFFEENEISMVMGGLTLLFTVLMVFISRNMHRTALTSLKLQLANEALVAHLSENNVKTEKLNEDLKTEIGERIQVEAALRESEEKFRGLVENATDGIVLATADRILYANRAAIEMSGFPEEALYEQPVRTFFSDDPRERERFENRISALREGRPVPGQIEGQLKARDGEVREVLISSAVIQGGEEHRTISIVKDITRRKEKENELRIAKERAERATMIKDRFVHLVAHDLRSPLASMSGMLDLLHRDPEHPLPASQKPLFELVMQSVKNLMGTIEDLLGHDRLQSGELRVMRRIVSAREMAGGAQALLEYLAKRKNIEVRNEIPPDLALFADPQLVRKVLQNLLGNAIKFSQAGGRITLFVPEGRPTTLAVQDTGVGIPAERLPFLFESKSGVATSGTEGETGTGQGLSFCREILQAHGGDITAVSVENEGSTFFTTFPPDAPKVMLCGEHRLFAEMPDYPWGEFEVDFVRAPENGGATGGGGNGVHLVVAAQGNNGEDPKTFVGRLRKTLPIEGVPIIMLLSSAEVEAVDRAFQGGVEDILINPTVPGELADKMLRFLR